MKRRIKFVNLLLIAGLILGNIPLLVMSGMSVKSAFKNESTNFDN